MIDSTGKGSTKPYLHAFRSIKKLNEYLSEIVFDKNIFTWQVFPIKMDIISENISDDIVHFKTKRKDLLRSHCKSRKTVLQTNGDTLIKSVKMGCTNEEINFVSFCYSMYSICYSIFFQKINGHH